MLTKKSCRIQLRSGDGVYRWLAVCSTIAHQPVLISEAFVNDL